jgi:hypothetical protein
MQCESDFHTQADWEVDHALGRSYVIVSNSSEVVFKQLINEIDYDCEYN